MNLYAIRPQMWVTELDQEEVFDNGGPVPEGAELFLGTREDLANYLSYKAEQAILEEEIKDAFNLH